MPAFITSGPLLKFDIDLTSKRVLQSSLGISPRSLPINFSYNDKIYANMRMWIQSGIQPPLYRVQAGCSNLGITDGSSLVYVQATGIALIGLGDESDPRIEFYMQFNSANLQTALRASGNQSITAFLEANITFLDHGGQYEVAIREMCNIFKSGLYPVPP
jgi:hypothetical protein